MPSTLFPFNRHTRPVLNRRLPRGRLDRRTKMFGCRERNTIERDRFIVRETEPPVRHPFSAPRRFVPLHGQPITAVLPTFLHVQRQFLLQLERAEGLDLARVKVTTPISRFLRLSLGMMFAQAAAHERRHMAQARRVWERLEE